MSQRDLYVIKHGNITAMRSYELKDYIDELRNKERIFGLSVTEMEFLEKAMEERDMRRKCKAYFPEKERMMEFNVKFNNSCVAH